MSETVKSVRKPEKQGILAFKLKALPSEMPSVSVLHFIFSSFTAAC